jgi:hypothetical protein
MNQQDNLFDRKHLDLWKISWRSDVLASLLVVIFAFLAIGEVYRYDQWAHNQFQTNLFGLFSQEPIYILDVALQMSRVILQGSVYYLVLKGIALGLNMIVETDINYREKIAEEGAE